MVVSNGNSVLGARPTSVGNGSTEQHTGGVGATPYKDRAGNQVHLPCQRFRSHPSHVFWHPKLVAFSVPILSWPSSSSSSFSLSSLPFPSVAFPVSFPLRGKTFSFLCCESLYRTVFFSFRVSFPGDFPPCFQNFPLQKPYLGSPSILHLPVGSCILLHGCRSETVKVGCEGFILCW